uniref:CUE domain-containing protein n=1 Tax=Timema tahoe TaxID=61484 RepID=A0A7R9IMU6_9NEOP|nr:unnamed protein product [Timema tahoe]
MMAAYFPEFSTIHHASVCQWMFELEASMSQKKRKDGNGSFLGKDLSQLAMLPLAATTPRSHTNSECSSDGPTKRVHQLSETSDGSSDSSGDYYYSGHERLPSMCFPPLPAPKTQTTQPSPSMEPQPGPSTEPSSAPLTFTRPWDKETWQRLAPDCTYEEYIATDDDITVWGTLDNADIIREQQESSNGEGEEEMEEEPEDIPTTKDVLKAGDVYSRADSYSEPQVRLLQEMFPGVCSIEVHHCLSIAEGDVARAAQLVLHRQEAGQSLKTNVTVLQPMAQRQKAVVNDQELKSRIIARYSYVDKDDDIREHRPVGPKSEPKKLVRYRDNKIVSLKGERFTEVKKEEDEDMKKTYVSIKPARQYRFH